MQFIPNWYYGANPANVFSLTSWDVHRGHCVADEIFNRYHVASAGHISETTAFHTLAVASGAATVPFLSHCFPALATFLSLLHSLPRPCGCSCLTCPQPFSVTRSSPALDLPRMPSHFPTHHLSRPSPFLLSFLPLILNMPDVFIHLLHSLSKLSVVTSEGSLGWVCWDCACDLCVVCQSTSVHQHIWRLCTLKELLKMSPAIKDFSS